MGSTGEPDRKRRHFNSLSPTAAAVKKQPFLPSSEDKKLDAAVLQYQNQKLVQKLEAQKVEYSALEHKFCQLKDNQEPYESTLEVVNKSWETLVTDLESSSIRTRDSNSQKDVRHRPKVDDGFLSSHEDAFLCRLIETGATESSSNSNCNDLMEEERETVSEKTKNMLCNIVAEIDYLWNMKEGLYATVLKELPEDGLCGMKVSNKLESEVKKLRFILNDLHLKHRSLTRELQAFCDNDAKNKAGIKYLRGELKSTIAELEESNCKLATLKADAAKGVFFPVLNVVNKHVAGDRVRDRQKDLQDMETSLKLLLDQAAGRLLELKAIHEERIKILEQLSSLQNMLKNVNGVVSSQAYQLLWDQLEKSKAEVLEYQALFEKLQVEKDNLAWREKEFHVTNDLVDVFRRSSAVADSRIADLEVEIQKQIDDRNRIEMKLEEASREPGRKEIIAEFKSLVSSFPEEMSAMQAQLSKYKEAALDIHSLRADVQSLSSVLDRKVRECKNLSSRSSDQVSEIHKLQAVIEDLKESDSELKLILAMYRRESAESSEVLEARDSEYKAWAHIQSLKSCLDEQSLELRVKTANEDEAISQQKLAAAEAEIADLRQKLEDSKRDVARLSDVLISKNEENDSYLSEIETIGQAYDDMQTQNQHLLQQITERDDCNIKLVLEGVAARQLEDTLLMDKQMLEREIQIANTSDAFYDMKAAKIEDQLKFYSDQVHKLTEDRFQKSAALENVQKRLSDVRKSSYEARESLEESQSKIDKVRPTFVELQIELEKETFDKKRMEEDLEGLKRKVARLRAQTEDSPVIEKLQQELREYKQILKCSICLDRSKQVVITKCYHLFCNPCVQRILESRHRKCPVCASGFGHNDVKSVYI